MKVARVLLFVAATTACAATPRKPAVSTMEEGESITVHGAMADPDTVSARIREARYVFLGELHDNPRHHQLQADMLRAIIESGRAPAVAFEMLDVDQMMVVRTANDPQTFGQVTRWEERGWPAYSMYRPIIELALQRGLPIVPANLSGADLMAAVEKGETPASLGFTQGIDAKVRAAMADDIREGHCGQANDAMAAAMVQAQELRNAYLAQRLLQSATAGGAVLITGGAHARRDEGAAFYAATVHGIDPKSIVSVGFVEGDSKVPESAFDIVWRTPVIQRPDPCVEFAGKLKAISQPK